MHFDASTRTAAHILCKPMPAMKNSRLAANYHQKDPSPVESERYQFKNAELELGGPRDGPGSRPRDGPRGGQVWVVLTQRLSQFLGKIWH
jgi:hypothetical protein